VRVTGRRVRCVVESMNYSACGLAVGDAFEVDADGLRITQGESFCYFAIANVLPILHGRLDTDDIDAWLATRPVMMCPDPPEALRMRLEAVPTGAEHSEEES
jgi:uncharacterized repeat protein (TIGR04076 family)